MGSCAVAHGQCLSGSLYQPSRGYSFPNSLQFSTSPLGMGSETQHISQCRTSIGGSECVSGLGVAPFRRLERLEALPSDIPLVDAGQRSLRARPVRESSERPVNPVLQLEAGSDGPSNRRPLAELGSRETIRISPLLSYNALSGEAQGRGGRTHTGDFCVAKHRLGIRVFWNCRSPFRFSYLGVPNYFRARRVNHTRLACVLTQKLALLLALTAPKRSSKLKLLDLRFMRILPEGVAFELPGMTKTSSEIIPVFFATFDDCESILRSALFDTRLACVQRSLQSKGISSNAS